MVFGVYQSNLVKTLIFISNNGFGVNICKNNYENF